jgi:hypothetical protein
MAEVPLFLVALLVARGLPALAYRHRVGTRRASIAGLMQATTLTFVIVATQIGRAALLISPTTSASLLAAGLLSAALFPAAALRLMGSEPSAHEPHPAKKHHVAAPGPIAALAPRTGHRRSRWVHTPGQAHRGDG